MIGGFTPGNSAVRRIGKEVAHRLHHRLGLRNGRLFQHP